MTLTLTKPDLFAAAARFISGENPRTYLQGVHVQPHKDGVRLAATDGHRLFVGYDEDGTCGRAAIIRPPKAKLPKSYWQAQSLQWQDGRITLYENGKATHLDLAQEIEGSFPDIERVVPMRVSEEPNQYNARHLHDFADVRKALGASGVLCAPIGMNGRDPALIGLRHDCFGVLMPIPVTKTSPEARAVTPPWF